MSIIERLNKIKPWLLPINIILVGTLGFGLGRWSKIEETKAPVLIENPAGDSANEATEAKEATSTGALVGSKNGTKYHYPWCSGAQRIKEENKIWFASKEEATAKGYTPAANCPGL
ncbi:MAG: hypothetical protein V1704_04715 [Candidatus Vogelbacteria bacterium]